MRIIKIYSCDQCVFRNKASSYNEVFRCIHPTFDHRKYMSNLIEGKEIPIFCPLEDCPKELDKDLE